MILHNRSHANVLFFFHFRELMNTLKYKSALCADLESQLAKVIEKNTQLTMANSDLQKKVVELHGVSEECATLKENLEKVQTDCHLAKSEVTNLNGKVRNLESVLAEMHKAAENRREIERWVVKFSGEVLDTKLKLILF